MTQVVFPCTPDSLSRAALGGCAHLYCVVVVVTLYVCMHVVLYSLGGSRLYLCIYINACARQIVSIR